MFGLSQYCRDIGEKIAGYEEAKVIDKAIETKDGKTES